MRRSRNKHLAHLRPFVVQSLVFLTVCTDRRRPILSDPRITEVLRSTWLLSPEMAGWWVGHFMIMPDHVHLFARPDRTAEPLSKWVGSWKSVSSRGISSALKLSHRIWQQDYFDRFLRSSENYANKWEYVCNNPVRAGFVKCTEDWPYQGVIHELMY